MGDDSERAALIYQHAARGADKRITGAIDGSVSGGLAIVDVGVSPVIPAFTRTPRRAYSTASERATSHPLGP